MLDAGRRNFVADLLDDADPGRVALIAGAETLTYGILAGRITERMDELALGRRSVVVLSGANSIEFVVSYLALLGAGHVPLLAGGHVDRLADTWHPAAVVHTEGDGIEIERRRVETRDLHPDLSLLLSTSGSTGAPKLVRLSDRNLSSNARSIVQYLGLGPTDRTITSLPLHYCYGLSLLHSHLAAGASVVITSASVVDPCFESDLRTHGVTNVAGVPHTFELLEQAGPERLHVPTLRFVTQAGGRMAPARVKQWVDRTEQWGVDLYVMYGQTEATARMAYLPPGLAGRHPGAIGVPIPGGHLELRPVDGLAGDVGELVYRGPNVMMGYATTDADLALGATVTDLPTGDLGRYHAADGVFEIVGRRSRFVKPFGVRVDLDQLQHALTESFGDVAVAGDDEHLVVIAAGASAPEIRAAAAEMIGLPEGLVFVSAGSVPRTDSGKIDYDATLRSGVALRHAVQPTVPAASVAAIYARVLGRSNVDATSTFVSLGGDSLNYVECSLRLERHLGHVPSDWHVRTVADLDSAAPRRRLPRLDTTVLLRAIGICAIVSTHMGLLYFPGGAHLLLAVAGYNLSRFQLPIAATSERVRAGLRTVARAAVPTVLWVAGGMAIAGTYGLGTLLLVNNYAGDRAHEDGRWHYWFIEVFVHLSIIVTLVLAVPTVRRLERRFPYWFPLAVFAGILVFRWEWAHMGDVYNLRFRTHSVAWFFVLGWLVHQSTATWQRLLTTAVCVMTIPDFFTRAEREWFIAGGLLVLVWLRDLPMARGMMRPIATVAGASMWILISHFSVWPVLDRAFPQPIAYVLTIVSGVAAWFAVEQFTRAVAGALRGRRSAAPPVHVSPLRTATVTT